jgi:tetratricopeptide (TPR) repeat protein
LALLALLAGLCSLPSSAAAQAPEAQAAEALFRQARSLMDAGAFAEACEKFAASHALEPGLGTLLYLGDCYERSGRLASALGTFHAAEQLARERGDAARQHLASVRAAALAPRAPTLEVRRRVGARVPDLDITLNGAPLRESDLNRAVPRDAGQYEIRFSAPGYSAYVSAVELKNGGGNGVVVTVPRLVSLFPNSGAADSAAPGTEPRPGDTRRVGAWVLAGTGVALGATAGLFAILALAKNGDSEATCDPNNPNRCGPEGVRLRQDAKDLATVATVSGLLGGACVASGIVLYVSAASSDSGVPQGALVTLQGSLL